MSTEFFRKVFMLYQIKRSNHKGQKIDKKLDQILWQEALTEVRTREGYCGK